MRSLVEGEHRLAFLTPGLVERAFESATGPWRLVMTEEQYARVTR